jgi:metallophosphoesterase (TIGR00282 family)
LKICFLGEIIGIPTVKALRGALGELRDELGLDAVIANGDGAGDGFGILGNLATQLNNSGVDMVTCGDYVFNKRNIFHTLKTASYILRPFNLPRTNPGRGFGTFKTVSGVTVGVINILGRTGFYKIYADDPFRSVDFAIEKLSSEADVIVVDFHGGTTSEIQAFAWYCAGRVSMMCGTHLRVLTSDNRVIKNKTAVITGTGYCGGYYSVGGLAPSPEISKIKTGRFAYSSVVTDRINVQGVIVNIDPSDGRAVSIDLLQREIKR